MSNLNCLQCRFAATLPQTNFRERGAPIQCNAVVNGQTVGPRCVNLEGCPQAEPLRRHGRGGAAWNPVADQMLRDLLPIPTMEQRALVLKWLGRSKHSFDTHARALGLDPCISQTEVSRINGRNGKMRSRGFNEAQSAYVVNRQKNGTWPTMGGDYAGPYGDKQRRIRRSIIKAVAKLGPEKSWKAIVRHCYLQSPAVQRRKNQNEN